MKPSRLSSFVAAVMVLLLSQACSNSDDQHFSEVVVGSWTLDHYEVSGADAQQDVTVSLDRLVMTANGRFTLYYPEGDTESGSYEAGDDYLRFDYTDQGGNQVRMLFEVLSAAQDDIGLRYKDPDYDVTLSVYLRRL